MIPTLQHDPVLGVDYVEVGDEPRHVEQLRNDYVRIYLATIEPGHCTLYHRHTVDTLYVVMRGGASTSQDPGHQHQRTRVGRSTHLATQVGWWCRRKLGRTLPLPTGTVLMQYHQQFPLTHRLCAAPYNGEPLRMLGIELPTNTREQPGPPAGLPGLTVEYHDAHATTYRVRLAPGQSTNQLSPHRRALIVLLNGTGEIPTGDDHPARTLASGDTRWFERDQTIKLRNIAPAPLHALVITLSTPADATLQTAPPPPGTDID